ncbi:MAG: TIGR03564 family F420-dependent LLM class oxidoreductase [Acidimicrobiales bacterium]|nr:TIGR03564 family F420-dependent LLM class oxidoreductase [Acidimicrobiales bacterium]
MVISAWAGSDNKSVDDVINSVRAAADAGFRAVWLPQTLTVDALTALALAAQVVPGIRVGTAVVPIQGRHPIPLAMHALTVAQAAGPGRVTLGIGVSHPAGSEGWYAIPYREVVDLCREELEALAGLLGPERRADQTGSYFTARVELSLAGPAPSLVVAALGPRMLELAGRLTDGTVTWMTGPTTLARRIVPAIREAAARAGRAEPRVIAGLPVCVTADPARAREAIRPRIEASAQRPSYRRQLALEGLVDPADLAVIGDRDTVASQVLALADLGVTELMAEMFGTPDERAETAAVLTGLTEA